MRISLHIVVALLLIALIYREILKGILPLVCGNHWEGMHSGRYSGLSASIQAVLFLNLYIYDTLSLITDCLLSDSLTLCVVALAENYLPASSLLFTLCICLSNISILNLPLFIPYSFLAL